MELSIIVTAHNVAPYIERCLESLLHQGLEDYEIIVVNDSSTDLTQPIIDRYVANYEHIHSLISPGIGLGARDYGLKFSKSDYFVLIDGDDYMKGGALGIMLEKIKESDGDIVACDIECFWDDDSQESYVKSRARKVTGDIKRDLILGDDGITAKIFKRSFWKDNDMSFRALSYEDLALALKTTVLASRIDIIEEPYYMDRQRGSSAMTTEDSDKLFDIFPVLDDIYSFFSTSGLLATYHDELEYLYIERSLVDGAQCFLRQDEDTYRDLMTRAFKMMKEFFPRYLKNPYINKLLTKKQRFFLRYDNSLTMSLWHRRLKS